ncbi:MAG TPA: hypothetical protein VNL91_10265 [Thermoanaerobaculia bacterium]|nr:hypothetical protein [Thermoanaerobaculia bacterium]
MHRLAVLSALCILIAARTHAAVPPSERAALDAIDNALDGPGSTPVRPVEDQIDNGTAI